MPPKISLSVLLDWIPLLKKLFAVPSLTNKEQLRDWLGGFCEMSKHITGLSSGEADDAIVDLLKRVIDTQDTWDAFYAALLEVLPHEPLVAAYAPGEGMVLPPEISGPPSGALDNIPWDMILTLIKMILEVIKSVGKD